ncbi:MAG: hypothetical protein AAF560_13295 [Acidobacteriota bacterium]
MNDPRLQAALVAAAVSLAISILTYWTAIKRNQAESENQKERLRRGLTEKLYALRLEVYPEAFEITSDLGSRGSKTDEDMIGRTQMTLDLLMKWEKERAGLVLSKRSLDAFRSLRDALSRKPGDGTAYTSKQLDKIWRARNTFRGRLRDDVGLLYEEDINLEV